MQSTLQQRLTNPLTSVAQIAITISPLTPWLYCLRVNAFQVLDRQARRVLSRLLYPTYYCGCLCEVQVEIGLPVKIQMQY